MSRASSRGARCGRAIPPRRTPASISPRRRARRCALRAGTVRAGRQVLVGKGGEVGGDVISREAIIGGEVRGSIRADERIEIQSTSVVHGDVAAKRLLVQEGGEINGVVRMGDAALEEEPEKVSAARSY